MFYQHWLLALKERWPIEPAQGTVLALASFADAVGHVDMRDALPRVEADIPRTLITTHLTRAEKLGWVRDGLVDNNTLSLTIPR